MNTDPNGPSYPPAYDEDRQEPRKVANVTVAERTCTCGLGLWQHPSGEWAHVGYGTRACAAEQELAS